MTFLLLFNSLKFSKTSLFCCNGYSRTTKKINYKRKKLKKSAYDFFIAVLLHFYDLKYQNFAKKRLSNQKSGMVLEVTKFKMNIVTKFQVPIFKNDKIRGGVTLPPPPYVEKVCYRGYME